MLVGIVAAALGLTSIAHWALRPPHTAASESAAIARAHARCASSAVATPPAGEAPAPAAAWLPDVLAMSASPRDDRPPAADDPWAPFLAAQQFAQQQIAATQFAFPAAACATRPILLVRYPGIGLASALGYVAAAYMTAVARGRVLVFDDRHPWNYGGHWGCFFEPLSACPLAEAVGAEEWAGEASWPGIGSEGDTDTRADGAHRPVMYDSAQLRSRGSWWPWSRSRGGGASLRQGSSGAPPRILVMSPSDETFFYHQFLTITPPPAPAAPAGAAYWRTLFMWAVFKPNAGVRADMARAIAAARGFLPRGPPASPSQRFVSWHIRQGDKVQEGFRTFEARAAAADALAVADAVHARSMFIASDSPAAMAEAVAAAQLHGLNVSHLVDAMPLGESPNAEAALVARDNPAAARLLLVDALTNMWMMSQGRALVGLFHSNFARYAAELQYAQRRAEVPFVWVDTLLCNTLQAVADGGLVWLPAPDGSSAGGGGGHAHPDREGYWTGAAGARYIAAARMAAGSVAKP
jgi:hypothetical protein